MRRRAYITIVLLFMAVAGAWAQGVTVRFSGPRLTTREALVQIREQTGCGVAFNGRLLDAGRVVDLSVGEIALDRAMGEVLDGSGLSYVVTGNIISVYAGKNEEEGLGPGKEVVKEAPVEEVYEPPMRFALDTGPTIVPRFAVEKGSTPTMRPLATGLPLDRTADALHSRPRFALKANLVYGAVWMTPNLMAEVALSPRSTVALSYSNNPWNWRRRSLGDNTKLLHGVVSPEYRYWFGGRFGGHFVGVHALYSEFNVSGRTVPTLFEKDYRYQGSAFGGGLSYGYSMPLSPHWGLEFTVGVGVARMKYSRFDCLSCDEKGESVERTWVGPTRLGVNLVWNFGHAPVKRQKHN